MFVRFDFVSRLDHEKWIFRTTMSLNPSLEWIDYFPPQTKLNFYPWRLKFKLFGC